MRFTVLGAGASGSRHMDPSPHMTWGLYHRFGRVHFRFFFRNGKCRLGVSSLAKKPTSYRLQRPSRCIIAKPRWGHRAYIYQAFDIVIMSTYLCIHSCFSWKFAGLYGCLFVCTYVKMYAHTCVCMYARMHACKWICCM